MLPHVLGDVSHQRARVAGFLFVAFPVWAQDWGVVPRCHDLGDFFFRHFGSLNAGGAAHRSYDVEAVQALLYGRWDGDSPNDGGQGMDLGQVCDYRRPGGVDVQVEVHFPAWHDVALALWTSRWSMSVSSRA